MLVKLTIAAMQQHHQQQQQQQLLLLLLLLLLYKLLFYVTVYPCNLIEIISNRFHMQFKLHSVVTEARASVSNLPRVDT